MSVTQESLICILWISNLMEPSGTIEDFYVYDQVIVVTIYYVTLCHTHMLWSWSGTDINLIGKTHLEACGAPLNKLDSSFCLDGSNGSIDIFGHHIPSVKEATGHVFAVAWVTLHHLDIKHFTLGKRSC